MISSLSSSLINSHILEFALCIAFGEEKAVSIVKAAAFSQINASGQRRNVTLINEHGMYRLVLRSKLPSVEKFTDWACDVLVSIRKTGSYTSPQYDFFHPSPAELERRSKITTIEGMIEDLDAHGIDWDCESRPRIEIDENGVEYVVYHYEVVIKHPEYEKLQKQRIEAKKSAGFLLN